MKHISTPDCSNFSTVKLFAGMLDDLKEKMENAEYEYFLEHILQLKKREINAFKFNKEHFRKLIDFYLKEKAYPWKEPHQDSIRLIN